MYNNYLIDNDVLVESVIAWFKKNHFLNSLSLRNAFFLNLFFVCVDFVVWSEYK